MENDEKTEDKWYSLPEVAKLLGVSHPTVWRWVKQGKLKAIPTGRGYKIPKSIIDKLLEIKEKLKLKRIRL